MCRCCKSIFHLPGALAKHRPKCVADVGHRAGHCRATIRERHFRHAGRAPHLSKVHRQPIHRKTRANAGNRADRYWSQLHSAFPTFLSFQTKSAHDSWSHHCWRVNYHLTEVKQDVSIFHPEKHTNQVLSDSIFLLFVWWPVPKTLNSTPAHSRHLNG